MQLFWSIESFMKVNSLTAYITLEIIGFIDNFCQRCYFVIVKMVMLALI